MALPNDRKILVVRYGTNIIADCIERHISELNESGYCWFAKLGKNPSNKMINAVFNDTNAFIVLYARSGYYLCKCVEVTDIRPCAGYPDYYDEYLFEAGLIPSVYFKLVSIDKMTAEELGRLVVSSSRNRLSDTLNRSMNSFFLAETGEYIQPKIMEKKVSRKKKELLDINDCAYRKDNKCTCKGFVNYQYECSRPSVCIRQKR